MKSNVPTEILPSRVLFALEEHPIIVWVSENSKLLMWGAAGLLALCLGIYQIGAKQRSSTELEYWRSSEAIRAFEHGSGSLALVQTYLERFPELHAKEDGAIAQLLLARGENSTAMPYAQSALDRTQNSMNPLYAAYAEATLLIGEKKYKEALDQALLLQKNIEETRQKEAQFGGALGAANLLRIVMMQNELGLIDAAKQSMVAWKRWTSGSSAEAAQVADLFQEGRLTLGDVIARP